MKPRRSKTTAVVCAAVCALLALFAVFVVLPVAPQTVQVGGGGAVLQTASDENDGGEKAGLPAQGDPAADAAADGADAGAADARGSKYEAGTVLVTLADGISADGLLAAIAPESALAGTTVAKQGDGYVKLSLPAGVSVEEATGLLESTGLVEGAQPNFRYYPLGGATSAAADALSASSNVKQLALQAVQAANDPYYASDRQWALSSVNAPEAWSLVAANAKVASAVTVAVIDEGFLVNHRDLAFHVVDSYDAAAGSASVGTDHASHGTHVAGIVGAVTNNGRGVAGAANNACGLMLVRASKRNGDITTDAIVDAYSYILKKASAHNVRVVNMSLGSGSRTPVSRRTDPALYSAIAKARNAGIVTVAAASNSGDGFYAPFYAYPGDFDNVVSVMNLAEADNSDGVELEGSSNYNRFGETAKNISAPGTAIFSTSGLGTNSYARQTGTSMASPLVAGVLGLVFTVNPGLSATSAEEALYSSAKDLVEYPASEGWDRFTGYGEIDAAAAVRAAGATVESSRIDVASLSISASNMTYTGKALKPTVKVVRGSTVLRRGVDYKVTYRGNKAVGKATYTVKGIGSYSGIAVGTFTIAKAKLKSAALKSTSAKFNGKAHKPKVKWVKIAAGKVASANYQVVYYRNGKKTANFKKAGLITVKITGKNNCKGAVVKTFRIR